MIHAGHELRTAVNAFTKHVGQGLFIYGQIYSGSVCYQLATYFVQSTYHTGCMKGGEPVEKLSEYCCL